MRQALQFNVIFSRHNSVCHKDAMLHSSTIEKRGGNRKKKKISKPHLYVNCIYMSLSGQLLQPGLSVKLFLVLIVLLSEWRAPLGFNRIWIIWVYDVYGD